MHTNSFSIASLYVLSLFLLGVPSVLRTSVGLRFQCTQIQTIRLRNMRYSLFAHTAYC